MNGIKKVLLIDYDSREYLIETDGYSDYSINTWRYFKDITKTKFNNFSKKFGQYLNKLSEIELSKPQNDDTVTIKVEYMNGDETIIQFSYENEKNNKVIKDIMGLIDEYVINPAEKEFHKARKEFYKNE